MSLHEQTLRERKRHITAGEHWFGTRQGQGMLRRAWSSGAGAKDSGVGTLRRLATWESTESCCAKLLLCLGLPKRKDSYKLHQASGALTYNLLLLLLLLSAFALQYKHCSSD